jgi:cytochrome c oxidase subunit II
VLAGSREDFLSLFSVYEWLMVAVTVIVFSVVLYAVARYRRRGDEMPRGKDKDVVGESLYVVLLAAIAAGLVTLTFRSEARIDPVSASPKLRIEITAFQWQWRFRYPAADRTIVGGPSSEPTLTVPAHQVVEFTARSNDVIHSFWVPDERFKRDVFPYRKTRFDLVFDRLGTHPGHCAEFCGLRHADMNFKVRVVSADEFRRWLGEGGA